jgi:hypothetical protein
MISQGLAHSQPSAMDPSRQSMPIHPSHAAAGSVGSSSNLALHMFNKGDSRSELFNGVAGRQLPSLAISLDSMKPQVKRAAAGSASSSGPPRKAPRLDIPEEGLHPGIQVSNRLCNIQTHNSCRPSQDLGASRIAMFNLLGTIVT